MKPITKAKWEALSEKEQWDVKVALRGPDCNNSETVKYFTTAVIRAACAKAFRVGGSVNDELGAIMLPQWGMKHQGIPPWKVEPHAWNYQHWMQHVKEASDVLEIPVAYVPADKWFEAISHRGPLTAILACFEAMTPEEKATEAGKIIAAHVEKYSLRKKAEW